MGRAPTLALAGVSGVVEFALEGTRTNSLRHGVRAAQYGRRGGGEGEVKRTALGLVTVALAGASLAPNAHGTVENLMHQPSRQTVPLSYFAVLHVPPITGTREPAR